MMKVEGKGASVLTFCDKNENDGNDKLATTMMSTTMMMKVCAGGEGKDACEGEGGAPLVCLDKVADHDGDAGDVDDNGADVAGDQGK